MATDYVRYYVPIFSCSKHEECHQRHGENRWCDGQQCQHCSSWDDSHLSATVTVPEKCMPPPPPPPPPSCSKHEDCLQRHGENRWCDGQQCRYCSRWEDRYLSATVTFPEKCMSPPPPPPPPPRRPNWCTRHRCVTNPCENTTLHKELRERGAPKGICGARSCAPALPNGNPLFCYQLSADNCERSVVRLNSILHACRVRPDMLGCELGLRCLGATHPPLPAPS